MDNSDLLAFGKYILREHGEEGRNWLIALSDTLDKLCDYWNLTFVVPIKKLTRSYVIRAIANSHTPVVVKINFIKQHFQNEILALTHFASHSSVKLIDCHSQYNALLLEEAIPGRSLASFLTGPDKLDSGMDILIEVMKTLHSVPLTDATLFQNLTETVVLIDEIPPGILPSPILKKAQTIKNALLNSPKKQVLLHGDLLYNNILQHGNRWIAIDPFGIVGEAEAELSILHFLGYNQWVGATPNILKTYKERVESFAKKSGLNEQRIIDWTFINLMKQFAWEIYRNKPIDQLKGKLILAENMLEYLS